MPAKKPIIIVTGANSGVGFGVCHRLIFQLSQTSPVDTSPEVQKSPVVLESTQQPPYTPADGATLILACRSQKRAETARDQLFQLLDKELARRRAKDIDVQHGEAFRKNLDIQIVALDLSSVDKVFACAEDIKQRFPYVTHMVLNAGVGSFIGIDWWKAVLEVCTDLKTAVTAPGFKLQATGQISDDGLGWVWQCNIFGHYILVRALRDMLLRSPYGQSRVMWMSSIEGRPSFLPGLDDWQLVKTDRAYEASKYSTELIACTLDISEASKPRSSGDAQLRHFVVHPGIVGTNIFIEHTGWLLDKLMFLTFYLARLLGSPHHVIHAYKAAISTVHIALVALVVLPSISRDAESKQRSGQPPADASDDVKTRDSDYQAVRYGAEANVWGKEYVGVQPVEGWEEHAGTGREMLARCDRLYQAFEEKRKLA